MFRVNGRRAGLLVLLVATFSLAQAQEPLRQQALDYVHQNHAQMGLAEADLNGMATQNAYVSKKTGVSHVYFVQKHAEIDVYNAILGVHLDRNGNLVTSNHRFVRNLADLAAAPSPTLEPAKAILAAAAALNLTASSPLAQNQAIGAMRKQLFRDEALSVHEIAIKLNYFPDSSGLPLVWNVNFRPKNSSDWWEMLVDAQTGQVLNQHNWTIYDNFTAKSGSTPLKTSSDSPVSLVGKGPSATYRAYDIPAESPNHGSIALLQNPADVIASPFGWHDTDGVAGAEFTITRGNNVHAYQDRDEDGASLGDEPDGGPSLTFDISPDFESEPVDYVQAATVNLFVWNNFMHDFMHYYGFDEASGNFQETNYTSVALGSDSVRARAQSGADTGRTNNANFGTPPDGSNPTMNMFEWTDPLGMRLEVTAPGGIAGVYLGSPASFGTAAPQFPAGITGDVELVDDASSTTTDACEALVGFTAGKIAILDRGACEFGLKVLNAENAGAIAALVVNNQPTGTITMGPGNAGGSVTIPSMMITMADGQLIKDALSGGATVTIHLSADSRPRRDSDYDNGVIAHEYGHGISNRLTGGAGNTSCLSNQEQMGEGWSDFVALALTTTSANSGDEGRGIGTYVSFQGTDGSGIRPWPYSTDMAINPSTYASISSGVSIPHGLGTVWCTMLNDLYWALVDRYGFDDDLTEGTGGNNIAIQLVLDGMKLQACSPGFVDGRDGILAADMALSGGANQCLIWDVFARRGLGEGASQGDSNLVGDEVESFTAPSTCCEIISIVQEPVSGVGCEGESYTLSVDATGTDNTYQWSFNGAPVTGATAASYTIEALSLVTAGNYSCSISNACSSETSAEVTVDVVIPTYSNGTLPNWAGALPENFCADINGNNIVDILDYVWLINLP